LEQEGSLSADQPGGIMNTEPALEQSEVQEQSVSLPFPKQTWGRILYGLFLTLIPAFSFWIVPAIGPEWQDGKFTSFVALSLFPEASVFFILLLIYSVVSYLFFLVKPSRYSHSLMIRIGIYTGVILALQFSLAMLLYSTENFVFVLLPMWVLPFAVLWVHRWGKGKWAVWKINIAITVVLVGILIILSMYESDITMFPFMVLIGLLAAAPFWSFLIALRSATWLFKSYETNLSLSHGVGLSAWFAAYAIGWRYDILKIFEMYSSLPTQPPNCYIATAAAQGHPRFVGSYTVHRTDGLSMQVNGQLQRLKCAELALLAVSPHLHRLLRKIYDVAGKALAQRMTNPFVADVAYLLLKPAEWFAMFILKNIVPEVESVSRRIYTESNVFAKHPSGDRRSTRKSGDF
jgi:hypothetical protein